MQMPEKTMTIALLSQAGESGRHLRDALADSGTPIVYESQAADFDRDALEKSGARVIVVSLDAEVEAHLDDIYALLDDDRYNVIFDESQVSSQLSGWEQARWARHLAAKILGVSNADPPRPEGAEPVPQRVVPLEAALPVEDPPALEPIAVIKEDLAIVVDEVSIPDFPQQVSESPVEDDDFGDLTNLLADPELDSIELTSVDSAPPAMSTNIDFESVDMPELDLSEFADVEETSLADLSASEMVSDTRETSRPDLDSSSSAEVEDVAASLDGMNFEEVASDADDALGFGDLDDFADFDSDGLEVEAIELDTGTEPPPASVESELAKSLESNEAAVVAELEGLQLLDLDLSDAPPSANTAAAEDSIEEIKTPVLESAFAWELESTDESEGNESAGDEGKATEPASFGIETISASDFLAPEAEAEEDDVDANAVDFSLELIPLEEAMAPRTAGEPGSQVETESWLDTSNKTAVSRVWVLGASIGGPEAVREFLAEIPANCPALFLLAQHMGAEFMEIMAQQLVRSTKLTVRTPSHGERVGHGDLLIVPITHRIRIDRSGVVTLEAQPPSDRQNLPSIDQVLQDVADRFGAKAGAIIFSGMAEDAAEGSRYLTEIGGAVFAQDPETCVISSMVDGVIETGVVSFVGSPKALASKLLGVLGGTTKS